MAGRGKDPRGLTSRNKEKDTQGRTQGREKEPKNVTFLTSKLRVRRRFWREGIGEIYLDQNNGKYRSHNLIYYSFLVNMQDLYLSGQIRESRPVSIQLSYLTPLPLTTTFSLSSHSHVPQRLFVLVLGHTVLGQPQQCTLLTETCRAAQVLTAAVLCMWRLSNETVSSVSTMICDYFA